MYILHNINIVPRIMLSVQGAMGVCTPAADAVIATGNRVHKTATLWRTLCTANFESTGDSKTLLVGVTKTVARINQFKKSTDKIYGLGLIT